ncbi:MAG: asparagine--tRNA ligase [Buchnera aphidicola (Eriosoma harunire)]
MHMVSVIDLYEEKINVNTIINIRGWVRSRRDSKLGFSFLNVYDGSIIFSIQCIVYSNVDNYSSEVLKLTMGCSVSIVGKLVNSKNIQQKYEILVQKIQVIGWVDKPNTYPISRKKHSMEFLRSVLHLRPRTNIIGVISRIRHMLLITLHDFLHQKQHYWIPTPIITGIDTEGSSAMFRVSTLDFYNLPKNTYGCIDFKEDFFGKESFLTVSGQLTLEAYASALSKVYTFGPTFRAENSNTSRHLAEFWMLEIEQSFSNLNHIISFAESMLKYVINVILHKCSYEIDFLKKNINSNIEDKLKCLTMTDFVRINYIDVINILMQSNQIFKDPVKFGSDLSTEHEKYIVSYYGNVPVIIKNYPKELKAFYMLLNDDQKTVSAFDILLPGIGEIIGGSEREFKIDVLLHRLKELNFNSDNYNWYLDLRRYGTVPHSGFGLGFERLLAFITDISNIKDLIPFPRTVKNSQC